MAATTTPETLPTPIAIDGPAASGKSTLGMELAERFGYRFLDTGLMYRAVTLAALLAGVPPERSGPFAQALPMDVRADGETRILLAGVDVTGYLRDAPVEAWVSKYSAVPGVREAMVRLQREMAEEGLAVLAGRDIGTVVLPNAPVKLFLEVSPAVKAQRRGEDSREARDDVQRDEIDRTRATSPMVPAADAIVIDTSELSVEGVLERALEAIRCAT